MKSQTIFKTSVQDFAEHCQEVVYTSRTFRRTMQGHFNKGYLHLSGYDTWGNPIALVAEIYHCPSYEAEKEAEKFEPKFREVESFLERSGLQVVDGTFQFGDKFVLGVIGDLTPPDPVSTEDHNPLRSPGGLDPINPGGCLASPEQPIS